MRESFDMRPIVLIFLLVVVVGRLVFRIHYFGVRER